MLKLLKYGLIALAMSIVSVAPAAAQAGPFSAQIIRALAAYGWPSPGTFSITGTGTCTKTALGTTSTDCLIVQNTTPATAATTAQISPGLRLRGTAWDTTATAQSRNIDFFVENLPTTGAFNGGATNRGTLQIGYINAVTAAITYPLTLSANGDLTLLQGITTGAGISIPDTTNFQWVSRSHIGSNSNGSITLLNSSESGFNLLKLGGTTASFPALNVNGTALEAKLADNSAYAPFSASAYSVGATAGISGTCDTPTFTGGVATTCGGSGGSVDGTYFVTGNFTTANNTNFQLITGLAWTFPANTALNIPFRCSLVYSQATAAVSDSLGIQDITVAPTNGLFTGSAETALGTTTYGDLTAFSSTTATAVVTFTPSAIATTFNAYIDGMIEQPSNASTSAFQIQIKTTTGADAITVYRGSYCKVG